MKKLIRKRIEESIELKKTLFDTQADNIEKAAKAIISSLKSGGKLFIFGNGGSASDSQHIAAELVGRFKKTRQALPAIALTSNTSALTAIANDYGYEQLFARQLESLGKKGDVALAISTSGNSKNVLLGVAKARKMGIATISLTGCSGGKMRNKCDIAIDLDSTDTPRVQESHITVAHIICELIEEAFVK